MSIYLDHAATTPVDARVLEEMLPYFGETFANAASLHGPGQRARRAVEDARDSVAACTKALPSEVVFTSGATEALNHAIRAVASLRPAGHIVTSALEHSAVLHPIRSLERAGHAVTYLTPNKFGVIDTESVRGALRSDTVLVALMLVNNETGVINDVASAARIARQAGAVMLCDAVQALGLLPIDRAGLGADVLVVSAHKYYGPKGAGALIVRRGLDLPPLIHGGEQERGRRAGTVNVPAVVGMGAATGLAEATRAEEFRRLESLRHTLQERLTSIRGLHVNGAGAPRVPKLLNVTVAGVDGEALLFALDKEGVAVSAGSACAAGTMQPSHVLTTMGLSREQAKASLRFSLGRGTTEALIEEAAERVARTIARLRERSG